MGFDFGNFGKVRPSESFVDWLVDEQWVGIGQHFGRLWEYYNNPMYDIGTAGIAEAKQNDASKNYVQGQEYGLPPRITGMSYSGAGNGLVGKRVGGIERKEVVIENDIAWRINAMVDFLFGKGIDFVSKASEPTKRRELEQIIKTVFAANGAAGFFQDMAVLGSVYGFVDCVVRPGTEVLQKAQGLNGGGRATSSNSTSTFTSFSSILESASGIGLELIEAPRALPVLDENDYRKIEFYVQNFYQQKNAVDEHSGFWKMLGGGTDGRKRDRAMVTEVIGRDWWQRYENKELVSEGANLLGEVPVVHVQNLAQPYYYEGISDVEQLTGLQDELNTRLSDRASRITFQAFKMYLAKGIEAVGDKPVSPGQMWCTDNLDASIEAFGGDGHTPSEDLHISEIREAMDKVSGVTPAVAGVLKNKLGNLTSGVALKMTFMGMLAKTERKQFTYGEGLKEIARKVLGTLDILGVYKTSREEREFEITFPEPLPVDVGEKINEAKAKLELGVPREQVFRELGYE
ncbi:Phage portal protein, SPP1 Gp6-like [Anaerohalosphaera lusitana]|uniref:Phage portal protein, SPP1 Gp6-like n=1 Tax=Anaerohalosphaera lusitana TaxID=1936003 RepID=A0A1U9NH84_9BACT|nr:phage portal protein [Anaerohalosphaera lusitana]AQT67118.1 Phage portal protein, SPP1 Gp6-like [Anaerohalosphaera lusitana]